MTRYSRELLGYAVVLFGCYGVFVSAGLGRAGWSPMFLVLGITAALAVLLMDSIWGDGLPSLIGVVHFCALGFAFGWGGYQVLLWAGTR
ncbi:MAG TPA: hypothetical protein VLA19_17295 [Herpetosiphonaceae bacterium]|nr:hypothetical protein [Herpetosiphonaceae bacterium]